VGTEHQRSIVINGKRYDAQSGKELPHKSKTMAKTVHSVTKALDVTRRPSASKHVHKTVERSKTLMRHAVSKPANIVKSKASSNVSMSDVKNPALHTKQLVSHPIYDAEREKRAHQVKRSSLVQKFSDHKTSLHPVVPGMTPITKKTLPLTVQPAPALSHHDIPVLSPSDHLIVKGLRAAQSHAEPAPKRHKATRSKRSRLASVAAGGMAVILLSIFFTYQNIPQISMRYAAAKAGVAARLPSYRPTGFAMNNNIQYNPGQITIRFDSNADERNFTITQRASTWNSDTLMSNFVAEATDQIQTFQDKGRTIYLYGESNATWVNGGVWYEIDGDSQLNSDQLIRIATSM
jgi:hypothetical protein